MPQIWQNVSENGPFFSIILPRSFKDQAGAWRNGTSFGLSDLEDLVIVAREAKEWMIAHAFVAVCMSVVSVAMW